MNYDVRARRRRRELGELPRPYRQHGTTAITLGKREASIVTGRHFNSGQALERRLELGARPGNGNYTNRLVLPVAWSPAL
jgi:hypothetical protein